MHAPKSRSLALSLDPDVVYPALVRVVEHGEYAVTERVDPARQLQFTSGKTAFSWGHQFVAEVSPSAGGSTLDVTCGGLDDKPTALLDGRKNAKAADKLLAAVERELPS